MGEIKKERMAIKYNGVTYPSVLSACKAANILPFCVYDRLEKTIVRRKHNKEYEGKTPQEIFDYVVANYEQIKPQYVFGEKSYSSIMKLIKENEISYYTFLKVKKENPNKTTMELVEHLKQAKEKKCVYIYNGKEYKRFSHLCKEYNIIGSSVYHRSRITGEPLMQAFEHFANKEKM